MHRLRIAAAAFLVFCPTLFFGWVYYDDFLLTTTFRIYSRLSGLIHAFTKPSWVEVQGAYSFYRPVSTAFYVIGSWISAVFSGQAEPWAFHLINLALHSANALLVHRALILLRYSKELAQAGALVFAVTPAAVPAVAWIPGQNELLLAAAGLASLVFLLRYIESRESRDSRESRKASRAGEERRLLVFHAAAFLAALLSKENAIAIPVAGLVGVFALPGPARKSRGKGRSMARASAAVALGTSWVAVVAIWLFLRQSVLSSTPQQLPLSEALRSLLAGAQFLPFYAGAFLLPIGTPVLPVLRDLSLSVGLLALAAWGVLLFRSKSRRHGPALFGAIWFLAFLFPTFVGASPDPAQFVLRGDRGYLASFGLLVLVLEVLAPLGAQEGGARAHARLKRFFPFLLAALALITLSKQREYRDGMAFYSAGASSSPHLALAATHLGDMHLARNDFEKAWASYQRALELDPLQRRLHNNIGVLHLRQGRFGDAEKEFLAETRAHPEDAMPWENLGILYFLAKKPEAAERALLQATEIDPELVGAWARLAEHYSVTNQRGKLERAREKLRTLGVAAQ